MVISILAYLFFIPISFMHYIKLSKKFDVVTSENDHHEDML